MDTDSARFGEHLEAVAGVSLPPNILSKLMEIDPALPPMMERLAGQLGGVNRTLTRVETPIERGRRMLVELEALGYDGELDAGNRDPRSKE